MVMWNAQWWSSITSAVMLYVIIVNFPVTNAARYCRPGIKFFNFKTHKCEKCPECDPGQFMNYTKSLDIDVDRGALECYPCDECPDGMFSNEKTVMMCEYVNNCEKKNRITEVPATKTSDSTCGYCHHGFVPDFAVLDPYHGTCYACSEENADHPNCANMSLTVQDTEYEAVETPEQETEEKSLNDHTDIGTNPYKGFIGAMVGILAVVVVLFGLVAVWMWRNKCKQSHQPRDVEVAIGLLKGKSGVDIETDGTALGSSSSGSSGTTGTTTCTESSVDDPVENKLSQDEENLASEVALKHDDAYIKAVGNSTTVEEYKCYPVILLSLGVKQTDIDTVTDHHPIAYLNLYIQKLAREANLLKLYEALMKHRRHRELRVLIQTFRKNLMKSSTVNRSEMNNTAGIKKQMSETEFVIEVTTDDDTS